MMSNSEVPRQGGSVNDFDNLEMPPVSARWDDPPSALTEDDILRMAPDSNDDELLAVIDEDLWAPVELDETREAAAERFESITKDGEKLRERWAETATLEEAFTAPPAVPTQVRIRKAHRERVAQRREDVMREMHEMRREHRVARIRGVVVMTVGTALVVAAAFGSIAVNTAANFVLLIVVGADLIAHSRTARLTSLGKAALRKLQRLGAVIKKPE